MEYLRLVGKISASVVLLGALLVSVGVTLALLPLFVALASKRGISSLAAVAPVTVLGGLLWRLWEPNREASREELRRAYYDGQKDAIMSPSPTAKKIASRG